MKRIKYIILTLGIMAGFGLFALPVSADPVDVFPVCDGSSDTAVCSDTGGTVQSYVKKIVNVLLYILGAVSVVVIIIAGIGYTTSTGDPAAITKAKSTLTYAVIGLAVAILAYAIVNYVIGIFNTMPAQPGTSSSTSQTKNKTISRLLTINRISDINSSKEY